MNAGRLSDRITIQRRILTIQPNGQTAETWGDDTRWSAEVERLSEQTCRFTVRYRPDLTPATHRIICFGAIWTITDAVSDRRKSETVITSDFDQLLEATHMLTTEKEFIPGLPLVRPPDETP
jgi:head-tail adaptor